MSSCLVNKPGTLIIQLAIHALNSSYLCALGELYNFTFFIPTLVTLSLHLGSTESRFLSTCSPWLPRAISGSASQLDFFVARCRCCHLCLLSAIPHLTLCHPPHFLTCQTTFEHEFGPLSKEHLILVQKYHGWQAKNTKEELF